jgi:leader peptidase (prepilin peptidase)/N-methyltransferase
VNATRVLPGVDTPLRAAAVLGLVVGIDAVMAWRVGVQATLPAYLVLGVVCAVVTVSDLAARKIPAAVVLPAYPIVLVLLVVGSVSDGQWWSLGRAVIAMAVLGGFYLALGLGFEGQFGIGDIEFGGLLGLCLGYLSWPVVVAGTLLAWCLAALAIPVRGALGRPNVATELPAGPFLVAGALVAVLVTR